MVGKLASQACQAYIFRARNSTAQRRVANVRVTQQGEHIYLDFADQAWRYVEIGPNGRRIKASWDARFS